MSSERRRWITIGIFAAALVFSVLAGGGTGVFWALSFLFFLLGVGSFLSYRRALRRERFASRVSDREEKTG